jgi:hypothetical protein
MSSDNIVNHFGAVPSFASIMTCWDKISEDAFADLKTYFTRFRNPIGIEVEVENYQPEFSLPSYTLWRTVADGSLKYRGIEFVSQPLSGRLIDYAIAEIAQHLKTQPELMWSNRTSIHVHQNMSSLRIPHLTALVALYGLYEDLFFKLVAPHRKGNPYCYPATSVDPEAFCRVTQENKYCALNLAPLATQATIEFRHLQGTDDWRLVRRWLQLIVKLYAFVDAHTSKDILSVVQEGIESEAHYRLFKRIFGATAALFPEEQVCESAEGNALWSSAVIRKGFV